MYEAVGKCPALADLYTIECTVELSKCLGLVSIEP